ncbi:hypothetical protein SNE40_022033 [Patella caerulea]|uniref:Reverse transcriptase domain-containing protein n=1 Tax=Patella caerulea TaxID=87958 RepID=A0AAN8IXG0_PATCE
MTKLDDKSGYDHVFVSKNSRSLLGFEWKGVYYVCNTIPFGWKNSAYVYHTLSKLVSSYLRFLGVNNLVYIDDRLIGSLNMENETSIRRAEIAVYMSCELVIGLGYFVGIPKCVLIPSQKIVYLGMIIDSIHQTFALTETKIEKFVYLREEILALNRVNLLSLQRFAGKCLSFSLAIPGAKLFVGTCFRTIATNFTVNSKDYIPISKELKEEIEFWRFLENYNRIFRWKAEFHKTLGLATDASDFKWAGILNNGIRNLEITDYWTQTEISLPILLKESKALFNSLLAFSQEIRDSRLDVLIDNKGLIDSWNNQYSRSYELNQILKQIFFVLLEHNTSLKLILIPSKDNPADVPSRSLSKSDVMISDLSFKRIDLIFGPHTVDLMSLDCNCVKDRHGHPLKHFTPYNTPFSGGTNVFSQTLSRNENYYVFPPFCLILPILRFVQAQNVALLPVPIWFPVLLAMAKHFVILAYKGDKHALMYPSKKGFFHDKIGIPWNLWGFRINTSYNSGHVDMWRIPERHFSVVILGDSIIKRLQERVNAKVLCIPGGKINDIEHNLTGLLNYSSCIYLFIHVGINDIMDKRTRHSEYNLKVSLRKLANKLNIAGEVTVFLSQVVKTSDITLNRQVTIFNEHLASLAAENHHWELISNDNIVTSDLADGLHLRDSGLSKLITNFALPCV